MIDFSVTIEKLEETQNKLKLCREWFQSTLHQAYTVEEMSNALEYYWNNHLYYYSNKPRQVPDKQQRIFKIENNFNADHARKTKDFNIQLAVAENKLDTVKAEIALYKHPFQYYMQGRYYHTCRSDGKELAVVIANVMDTLKEGHSPYFEFFFDDDLQPVESNYGQDLYDFFCDVHFLQFLRRTLASIQTNGTEDGHGKAPGKNKITEPLFNSFEELFKEPSDYKKVLTYCESIFVLAGDGTFIDLTGNKKYFAVLPKVLKAKKKIKPIKDSEMAHLMGEAFKMHISASYFTKEFIGRDEVFEEMMKGLQL